jgi:signal transduction histidine kinase
MKRKGKLADLPTEEQQSLIAAVRCIPAFANMTAVSEECLMRAELIEAEDGDRVRCDGEFRRSFWILVEGGVRAELIEPDGSRRILSAHNGCESFGEVPLLTGLPSQVDGLVAKPSRLLRLDEDTFWNLMASCPEVRNGILANMSTRLEGLQGMAMQREKMASLGTMAAGLMHELNNPGAAARRATAQLRENLTRLQELNLSTCRLALRQDELECIAELQQYILRPHKPTVVCSLDQADAEESLAQWLEQIGIEDGWKLAPPLVGMGLTAEKLNCARASFRPEALSGALHWVESLVSSIQQLQTIEESIARITELVLAVKHYSYGEKMSHQTIDLHEGLQSTLIILGHKIRQKEIHVSRQFGSDVPILSSTASGLNQVWTNLLDNAIDAAPQKGNIAVRTWVEGGNICVGIHDDGAGVSAESAAHIFEPFFTSKAVGVGTGLGLSIADKIVRTHFGGEIDYHSQPGNTEFIVRLPQKQDA